MTAWLFGAPRRLVDEVVAGDGRIAVVVVGDLPPHVRRVTLVVAVAPVGVRVLLAGVAGGALAADHAVHVDDHVDAARAGLADEPIEHVEGIGAPAQNWRYCSRDRTVPTTPVRARR